jgi:hypothetical protein
MMSLSVSGDGPWVAWWKSANGTKHKRFYAQTRDEAELQVKRWERTLEPGEQIGIAVMGQTEVGQVCR